MIWFFIVFILPLIVIPFIVISLGTSSVNIEEQRRKRKESKLSNFKELIFFNTIDKRFTTLKSP